MIAIVASSPGELPEPQLIPPRCSSFSVGVGLVQSALHTARIINTYDPEWIICIGTCGAIDRRMAIGDLVIGSSAVHYGIDLRRFGLDVGTTYDPEGNQVGMLHLEDAMFRGAPVFRDRNVHRGVTIGSADIFLVSEMRKAMPWVEKELHVGAVDMESYAVCAVGNEAHIPVSVLRVVSDTWQGHRPRSYRVFLKDAITDILALVAQCTLPSEKSPMIL